MTPQQMLKLRRFEVMRARVRNRPDPHLQQARDHNRAFLNYYNEVAAIADRQADALERIAARAERIAGETLP